MEEAVSRLKLTDDSEDEDEMEQEEEEDVELGFCETPEHPWVLQRQHFPCKVGGAPAWLDPVNIPRMDEACCGVCEEPLQFLCQIYAPLEDTVHRTLFVFICTKLACLSRHQMVQGTDASRRSVKVFRSQLPHENAYYSSQPPTGEDDLPLTKGVELCSWCGTWRGEKTCGGCRRVKYCSRKHQVEHWRDGHSSSCKGAELNFGDLQRKKQLWREFEIIRRYEDEESDEEFENNSQQIIGKSEVPGHEFQGFQQASKDKQCWASFQTRIAKAPSQVLRYCRRKSAKPLWMALAHQPSSIKPCQCCGGERTFEFQLLPQLLYYLGVDNEPQSLDWGTIAVYTCAASCPVASYVEEVAWLQM